MTTPFEKLAQSLEQLKVLQNSNGIAVVTANDLSRTHRERLVKNGFLKEVLKGWFISTRPEEKEGDTTSWHISFWYFMSVYFKSRFGNDWCLSAEQSLSIHSGNMTVPKQLLVRSPKAQNNMVSLLHGTSILDLKLALPPEEERENISDMQVYSLPAGLLNCSPGYFKNNPTDSRTCLSLVRNSSEILSLLLVGGHSVKAGRLSGAFRNIGNDRLANEIISIMKSAGYDVREVDPFQDNSPFIIGREASPYVTRIRIMWQQMRSVVLANLPEKKVFPGDQESFIKHIEESYKLDAYHSLSIEGYHVTMELIERVRSGSWNPLGDETDKMQKDAMAARGYWQAFQKVKDSIKKILNEQNPGQVADEDHGIWYAELFAPSVAAGIIKTSDLAGYRNSQVYIKGSMHVPPNIDAVYDVMPVLFELIKEEPEPVVRAVLGHFIFVYIHPYMDGNGRISRFLMNVMLASGGYKWTVIPVDKRNEYMDALEKASINQDISVFSKFIGDLITKNY